MTHTLAELCEGETVLIAVGADPRFAQAKFKSTALAGKIAIQIARDRVVDSMRETMLNTLAMAIDEFVSMNGQRPEDASDRDEWESAADDVVAHALEPYADVLSASWLGTHTVDTRIHLPGEIQTLAMQFAQEVWGQLTYHKTENQILAGVGVVEEDLTAMLSAYAAVEPKEEPPKMTQLNAVLNKIMLAMPDDATLEEDLDLASDTDDGLAVGAGQRLGITLPECMVLRRDRTANSINDWAFTILTGEMLPVDELELPASLDRSLAPPPPPPPPKAIVTMPPPPPAKGPQITEAAPPGAQGRKRVAAAAPPPPQAIPQETLVKLKTFANIRDEDVALMFGVSRPTMNNYLRGKGHAVPTPVQRETLKAFVQKHLDALQEVMDEIG